MSVVQTEKLVRALIGLRRAAETLQAAAQGYLDDHADPDKHCHMDRNGLPKSGPARQAVNDEIVRVSRACAAMPIIESAATDAAELTGRLDSLRPVFERYESPPRW